MAAADEMSGVPEAGHGDAVVVAVEETMLMAAEGLVMALAITGSGLAMACWTAESAFVKAAELDSTAGGMEETVVDARVSEMQGWKSRKA